MSLFRRRFTSPGIPFPTVKVHVLVLLMGLDYLHSVCKIVHTGVFLKSVHSIKMAVLPYRQT